MGKTQKKVAKEFKGLKGWEIKYLKQSLAYGHLDGGKQQVKKGRR